MATTYSFLDTHASITGVGGSFDLKSGASEEGITIAMDEDKSTTQVGADGTLLYSLHASNLGTITVSVLKNSTVNSNLSRMYNLQKNSALTWGKNTIRISTNSGDIIDVSDVAFKKSPDVAYGKDATYNVWTFTGSVSSQLSDLIG